MINLYSDTQTLATKEMLEAMVRAEVGDDVSGTDPTVNRLQEIAAAKIGQEAALFVPSGSMGNLVSLLAIGGHGNEILLHEEAHVYYYEGGALCSIAGFTPRLVAAPHGIVTPEILEGYLRPRNVHHPRTTVLALENTHNRGGGTVTQPELHDRLVAWAHGHGLHVHLDGARVFNAAIACGVDVKRFTANVDSVQFCLSKGLSAPVGSIVAGQKDFIDRARQARKRVGGAMRQAGHLAAAGIVALEKMVDRLAEDHAHAKKLAQLVAKIPGFTIDMEAVQTNMVYADFAALKVPWAKFIGRLEAQGLKVSPIPPTRLRMVTHRHIGAKEVEQAASILAEVAGVIAK
jgi:threonine aldolase